MRQQYIGHQLVVAPKPCEIRSRLLLTTIGSRRCNTSCWFMSRVCFNSLCSIFSRTLYCASHVSRYSYLYVIMVQMFVNTEKCGNCLYIICIGKFNIQAMR